MTLKRLDKCPWPWFGGKTGAAPLVWSALGDIVHYVEPFMGSLAVLLLRPHATNRAYYSETVNDLDGLLCLGPDTRVLTDTLRWVRIGDVQAGDGLLGFDEHNRVPNAFGGPNRFRRWRRTVAVSTRRVVKNCWRLMFDDGTTVIASEDHLWLSGSHRPGKGGRAWKWAQTRYLKAGNSTTDGSRSWILKLCEVQEQDFSYDSGWLSGFLDGEGNVRSNPGFARITASQKNGPESDKFFNMLRIRGFDVRRTTIDRSLTNPNHHAINNFVVNGGARETLRLLMAIRPERLVANCLDQIDKCSIYAREHQAVGLVDKERLGATEVVALETDCHTYIAEGLASHNCNAWRAMQWRADATAEAASWPVSECDLHARHQHLLRWRADSDNVARLCGSVDWCDPVAAGYWIWGQSCWIGSGWCSGRGPWVVDEGGRLVRVGRGAGGAWRQLPHIGDNGKGANHAGAREPGVSRLDAARDWSCLCTDETEFHAMTMPEIRRWFEFLAARLRHVRILCGDWTRAVTSGTTLTLSVRKGAGPCGVFLDPPYSSDVRDPGLYACDDSGGGVAEDVRAWCAEHGDDPRYRIVLAGFTGEGHEALVSAHGWREVEWFKKGWLKGGMANVSGNGATKQKAERLWMSPHCLTAGEAEAPDARGEQISLVGEGPIVAPNLRKPL